MFKNRFYCKKIFSFSRKGKVPIEILDYILTFFLRDLPKILFEKKKICTRFTEFTQLFVSKYALFQYAHPVFGIGMNSSKHMYWMSFERRALQSYQYAHTKNVFRHSYSFYRKINFFDIWIWYFERKIIVYENDCQLKNTISKEHRFTLTTENIIYTNNFVFFIARKQSSSINLE